jgi:hypothetical protein
MPSLHTYLRTVFTFSLLTISNTIFAVVANGTYNFGVFTDGNPNLTHNDFILSGTANGATMNMAIDGSLAYGENLAISNNDACVYKLAADGTNTGSFELTGISANDYNNGATYNGVKLVGNLLSGGTVQSVNTINDAGKDFYNTSDFGLGSFSGQQITSFEIQFTALESVDFCTNIDFNSFSISNAQAPGAANAAPTLTGESVNQAVSDTASLSPFSSVVLVDGESDNVSIALSLDDNAKGTLSATTIASGTLSSVQASLRAITFTPTANRVAVGSTEATTLTIVISDATGSNTYTATSVVSTSINDAPSISTTAGTSATEDVAYSYDAGATDDDTSDTQVWSISNTPTGMALNTATGVVSWTPANGVTNSGAVLLTVTDSGGLTATQSFTISVNAVNDAPVITSGNDTTATYTVAENQTSVATITSTDVDSADNLFSTTLAGTDAGSFTITTAGVLTFNTAPDFETKTTYTVIVTASDGALTDTQTITVHITNVNDNSPVFSSTATLSVNVNSAYSYSLVATDADTSDTVSFSASTKPSWLTLSGSTLSGTPVCGNMGNNSVSIVATDGTNNTTQSWTVNVTDTANTCNAAPTITGESSSQAVNDNASLSPFSSVVLVDGESDNVSITLSIDDNAKGTLSATTIASGTLSSVQANLRAITFTPTANRVAVGSTEATTLTIVISDATGSNTYTATSVVSTSINDAPTAVLLAGTNTATVNENNSTPTIVAALTSTDIDVNNTHTYTLVAGAGSADNTSFAISGTNLQIITVADFEAKATYTIRVQTNDGNGGTFANAFIVNIGNAQIDSDSDGVIDDIEYLIGTSDNDAGYYGGTLTSSTDVDSDGLPDSLETYIKNTFFASDSAYTTTKLTASTDTDKDGLPDALEVIKGFNPNDVDSPTTNGKTDDNANLLTNAVDAYMGTLSATVTSTYRDIDSDGLPDALEIKTGSNPQSADSPTQNGNSVSATITTAMGKYLESKGVNSVNKYTDTDKDLMPDVVEVALGSNPFGLSIDSDSDGIADAAELYLANNGGSATLTTTIGQDSDSDMVPNYLDIALPLATRFNDNTKVASDESTLFDWMTAYAAINYPDITVINNSGLGDSDGDTIIDKTELITGFNPFVNNKPYANIGVFQAGDKLATLAAANTTTFAVNYKNAAYYHNTSITYAWYLDDDLTNAVGTSRTFTKNANTLSQGTHKIKVILTLSAVNYTYATNFRVAATADGDSDNDGIADADDTLNDQGGLSPNAESTATASVIKPFVKDSNNNIVENSAMVVRAGAVALEYKKPSANVSELVGITNSATGKVIIPANNNGALVDEVFDFEVSNIPVDTTEVQIVIPLKSGLPAGARYEKLTNSGTWQEYTAIETANSVAGSCYDASVNWVSGVNTGADCARITLTDGDITFDLDGEATANGQIKDPGAFVIPNDGGINYGSGGGGCVLSNSDNHNKFDPTLYILLTLALLTLFRKNIIKIVTIATLLIGGNSVANADSDYYIGFGIGKSFLSPEFSSDYTANNHNNAKQLLLGMSLPSNNEFIKKLNAELSVVDLGNVELTNSAGDKSIINYKIKTLGLSYYLTKDKAINPFIGLGYRHISQNSNDNKPVNANSYYAKFGADITLNKASNTSLRISYNRYARDAKASFVSLVWKF